MDKSQYSFSESSHAILFALIARQIITQFGKEAGLASLRRGVQRYGEQRGQRMALRALANGDELTMTNFLAFGEWRSVTGSGKQELVDDASAIHMTVSICPWANAWMEVGLVEYGRYYCQEIDTALVRGFNPCLLIEVNRTLTNDDVPCQFVYHQAVVEQGKTLEYIRKKAARMESQTVMPWEYHCGHLYQTFSLVMGEDFGLTGRFTVQNALAEFALRYGGKAAGIIAAHLKTDFCALPN